MKHCTCGIALVHVYVSLYPQSKQCCNLSGGVALNVCFTTNGMCAKNNNTYMWREQAVIEWSRQVTAIVACCHSVKLCAHAAWTFRSQQNGAVTRMRRSCRLQPSHKERVFGLVRCKKEGMLLQPLWWRCVDCVIHYERDVCEEQQYISEARASNTKSDCGAWTLLLLAATVWSFANMPLGLATAAKPWGYISMTTR